MPHYSRLRKVVIDVPPEAHDEEVRFWQGAIGRPLLRLERHPEYHGALLPGEAFGLLVQQLEDGESRVHLDIHTDDLEAEVARLEGLGAARVRFVHDRWWVMRDPAGMMFCVLPDPPGSLDDTNAQRWD
ncbi:glyoxalase/bleomycin resistance/dioxygenase family protein [Sphaerisporangium album]|uniref:Glyoxalase/bleomycin resistance/dioxygenase family protein n=1 Tax=Sphaerisporangium album TaxID=509200 RepID=A0A367F472_9ACTN|nr:glyoxalase/bleomycin resistance/dioxygenase family protein [Sphaerisporangium album]